MRLTWSSAIGELCECQPQCEMWRRNSSHVQRECRAVDRRMSICSKQTVRSILNIKQRFVSSSRSTSVLTETLHCRHSQKITTVTSSLHNMGKRSTNQAPRNIDLDQHDGLMLESRTRTDRGLSERQKLIG